MKKYSVIPFILMGCIYVTIEIFWRGRSHWSMFIVGGMCGVLIDLLNEHGNMSIRIQSFLGALITLGVEFVSGLILNVWLGLNVWDYSKEPFNIMGQICPQYKILWFMLMPLTIWVGDMIRWGLYRDRKKYNVLNNYRKLISIERRG